MNLDINEIIRAAEGGSRFEDRETHHSDGSITRTRRVKRSAILALKDVGASPSQIVQLVSEFNARGFATQLPVPIPVPVPTSATLPSTVAPTHSPLAGMTLTALVISFNDERIRRHSGKSKSGKPWQPPRVDDTRFRRLCEVLGDTTPITAVDRQAARRVAGIIGQLPVESGSMRKQPITTVIAHAQQQAKAAAAAAMPPSTVTPPIYKRLSTKQFNNHISLYTALFAYAITEGLYNGQNPFEKLTVIDDDKQKANALRDLFERDELTMIFAHPIFTDYVSYLQRTGKLTPYRFWTPLIGLYTGARPCEIGGLYLEDVKQVQGVWVFDFNENHPGKCGKTVNSLRRTPIHSHLLDLGLLEYCQELQASGAERLFPDLKLETRENGESGYGRYVGETFVSGILVPLGLHKMRQRVFYSFRHCLTTMLSDAGVEPQYHEQICGRDICKDGGAQAHYIKDRQIPMLKSQIERTHFREELKDVQHWTAISTALKNYVPRTSKKRKSSTP